MRGIWWRLVLLLFAAVPAVAGTATIEGEWLNPDGDARVRVVPCEEGLCGSVVWLGEPEDESGHPLTDVLNPDAMQRSRTVLGMRVFHIAASTDADGVHRNGTIYDPKSGKTYRCNVSLEGEDVLRLRGYLGVPLIGRTTAWRRVAAH